MRMLYKCPGPKHIQRIWCETIQIDEKKIDLYLNDGWFLTTHEANEAHLKAKTDKTEGMKSTSDNKELKEVPEVPDKKSEKTDGKGKGKKK